MKIAVNDANIFIDLILVELLKEFFDLDLVFYTTALVVNELDEDEHQRKQLQKYIKKGVLKVENFGVDEIVEIKKEAKLEGNLSIPDVSVYYFASKIKAMILTGDKSLREVGKKRGFEVHGILWVFDQLLASNRIDLKTSIERLTLLMEKNTWLPLNECTARIAKWQEELDKQPKVKQIKKKRK